MVLMANPSSCRSGADSSTKRTYCCTVSRCTSGSNPRELQKLIADDGTEDDNFGTSVAINRATETIVVGATDAVYVFTCQGSQFVQTQKLTASDPGGGGAFTDEFGGSVAIDGDTIVVGARNDNNENVDNAGAAYVYI